MSEEDKLKLKGYKIQYRQNVSPEVKQKRIQKGISKKL